MSDRAEPSETGLLRELRALSEADGRLRWHVASTSAMTPPAHAFTSASYPFRALCGAGPALASERPDGRKCRRCAALATEPAPTPRDWYDRDADAFARAHFATEAAPTLTPEERAARQGPGFTEWATIEATGRKPEGAKE